MKMWTKKKEAKQKRYEEEQKVNKVQSRDL